MTMFRCSAWDGLGRVPAHNGRVLREGSCALSDSNCGRWRKGPSETRPAAIQEFVLLVTTSVLRRVCDSCNASRPAWCKGSDVDDRSGHDTTANPAAVSYRSRYAPIRVLLLSRLLSNRPGSHRFRPGSRV